MNFDVSNPNYEFTESQNNSITKLAKMMTYVSIIFFISGGLQVISSISPLNLIGLLQGGVLVLIGYSLFNAAKSFKKIVETSGNDIDNLMNAIEQLYNACATQLYSILAVIVLAVIVTLVG